MSPPPPPQTPPAVFAADATAQFLRDLGHPNMVIANRQSKNRRTWVGVGKE